MNNNHVIIVRKNESKDSGNGNKIIQWNVSDPTDSLYSVVTPIKLK